MNITWEDRKDGGWIDGHPLLEKPVFSFDYAWFSVVGDLAEYVESHDDDAYNKDLGPYELDEIMTFYSNYVFDGVEPEFNSDLERVEPSDAIEIIDGKRYSSFNIVPLTPAEQAERLAEKINALKEEKRMQIRSDFEEAISPPIEALGITWNSGFDSSLSIDGAARIAQAAGLSTVGIHSLDNRRHVLSIAEATQVAIAIGGSYQQQLGIKQARMVTLDEIDLSVVNALELIGKI